jgi:tetratricopeptide (TPR) repeat protein
MGQLLVRRHQFDEAIPHLKLALQSLPPTSLPEVHSLLAKCYSARGAYTQALGELKPALPADTMGTYYYQLYQLYRKLGDQKSANMALLKSEKLRQEKARTEQEHTELTRP